jgi:transcriptional regulator with XRE-family HTH domain
MGVDRKEEMKEALKRSLPEWRRLKGFSQEDLPVTPFTVMSIEAGRHLPRPSTLRKLAAAFGITVEELYQGPELPKDEAPAQRPRSGQNEQRLEEIGVWVNYATKLRQYAEELLERREDAERLARVIGERRHPETERQMLALGALQARNEFKRLEAELDGDTLSPAEQRTLISAERTVKAALDACMITFEQAEALERRALQAKGEEVDSTIDELDTWRRLRLAAS